jgi:hypothetical protein
MSGAPKNPFHRPGFGTTSLAAPDGSSVQLERALPDSPSGKGNRGEMWSQLQNARSEIKALEDQMAAKERAMELERTEREAIERAHKVAESRVREIAAEVQAAREREEQRQREMRELEQRVAAANERAQAEAEAHARAVAERGPPPPPPEEVELRTLKEFDAAAAAIGVIKPPACASGSAADGDIVMATGDDDADTEHMTAEGTATAGWLQAEALMAAGLPMHQIAAQYIRAAMEHGVAAGEEAKLEVARKWQMERKQRRQLQDALQELKGSIRVMCRVRPPNAAEAAEGAAIAIPADAAEHMVTLTNMGKQYPFAFDHVFASNTTQAAVFEEVEPVLDSVLGGFNVCIFAYGQTGSGKTFTMQGKADDDQLLGINPRALRRLFELIEERKQLASVNSAKGQGKGKAAQVSGSSSEDGWVYEVEVSS